MFIINTHKMDYNIRVANERDIPAILNLFKIALGTEGGAPIESFWRWKHIDNPFGVSPVLLAFDKDQLIGLRAFMRWQWAYKNNILPAFRAVDTATHPDYRGKGIFSKLTKALIKELQVTEPSCFIYNTPNSQSKPGYLKMGWKVLGKPNVLASLVFAYSINPEEKFKAFHRALQQVNFDTLPFKPAVNNGLVHTNQSLQYYKWRYQSIPEIPYGTFTYNSQQKSVMLFFHLKERGKIYELRICDEIWFDGITDQRLALQAYHKLAKKLGTPFVSFITNNELSVWQRLGNRVFTLQKYSPDITVREVNDETLMKSVQDIDNWAFSLGDLELF
jgi:GNAT superfamily N-acetyltransferase